MVDPFEAIKATFFVECEELLADLEGACIALSQGSGDHETINAAFRAVHSIKGGAGAFGLDALVRFAHVFETFMDVLRSGQRPCDDAAVKAMLQGADVLADHVAVAKGETVGLDEGRSTAVAQHLEALTNGPDAGAIPEADSDADPFGFTPVLIDFEPPLPQNWRVLFKPYPRLYENGNEPALLLRELARLGSIDVALDWPAEGSWDDFTDQDAFLQWTVSLPGHISHTQIQEVFEFVEGECDLTIEAVTKSHESAAIDVGALLLAASEPVSPPPEAAPAASKPASDQVGMRGQQQASIRVDLDRIDKLINVVGELVIQQAVLAQSVAETELASSSSVAVGLDDLERLTREIQESVMAIRAQPVKSVFQRMPRLVREVAELTGKAVRLVTEGEATEVDKTVIDRLAEPITHMIRNAIDHGLEDPDGRRAAGKPVEGVIKLAALHRSGRIVIEVSDDGRGINREKVKGIAVAKGLIAPEAALTNDEIDNLIFLPGFSTADAISDISGRGVGMDVVRRSIQALGGRISIASTPGQGSTFTMSLPLTLAVLDGMVVQAGGQTLLAPLSAVVESFTPKAFDLHRVGAGDQVIRFRDRFIPLLHTADLLGFKAAPVLGTQGIAIVVETENGNQAALWVDAIQGQRQVVIKSLESNYRKVDGIAAATILGDGRVALILDVDSLFALSRQAAAAADLAIAS